MQDVPVFWWIIVVSLPMWYVINIDISFVFIWKLSMESFLCRQNLKTWIISEGNIYYDMYIFIFIYCSHFLELHFQSSICSHDKVLHSFHLYGPWGCWWGQNFVDGKIVRKCFLSYLSDRNENKQSQWFCLYLALSCLAGRSF